tara:strand:- start:14582 stop:15586 length:1005 start_codon:yes stop_codon:yes gene_type:complete
MFQMLGEGTAFTMGAMPATGPRNTGVYMAPGQSMINFAGQHFSQAARTGPLPSPMMPMSGANIWTSGRIHGPLTKLPEGPRDPRNFGQQGQRGLLNNSTQGFSRFLGPVLGMGSSAYFAYQGYQENGMSGLYDSLMLDVAVGASVTKHAYIREYFNASGESVSKKTALRNAGEHIKSVRARTSWLGSSILSGIATGAGAYILGGVGQELGQASGVPGGGTMGTIAGAFLGARIARSPLSLLGYGAMIVGGSEVVKGAYNLLKTGYRRKQFMRQAHTAGDTAAFMTGSAVTMRQRAVTAMQKTHMNARSALGMEASYMHMPRNYFSVYSRQGNMM